MELSLTKLIIIAIVILVLFGGGKLPSAMKDLGKGIRNFKKGLSEDDDSENKSSKKSITEDKNS
jgi:sec-independent protein translocase protein TatA